MVSRRRNRVRRLMPKGDSWLPWAAMGVLALMALWGLLYLVTRW